MKKTSLVLAVVLVMLLMLVGTAMAQEPLTLSCETVDNNYSRSEMQFIAKINLINKTVDWQGPGVLGSKESADITEAQIKWTFHGPNSVWYFIIDRYTSKINIAIQRTSDFAGGESRSFQGTCTKVTKQY